MCRDDAVSATEMRL
jgi:hypothetical protein